MAFDSEMTAQSVVEIFHNLEPWDAQATALAIVGEKEHALIQNCEKAGSSESEVDQLRLLLTGLRAKHSALEESEESLKGIIRASEVIQKVQSLRDSGFKSGAKIGIHSVDSLYTVVPGQVSIVTGHPGSGKSEVIDAFMVRLAEQEGWKFAVFSAENPVDIHVGKIVEKHSGRSVFSGEERLDDAGVREAIEWADEFFFFLNHDSTSVDSILKRSEILHGRFGINGLVIDPFNYLDVPLDTDSINRFLSKVKVWAEAHHCHVWIIAHPTKMMRENGLLPVPKGNDISGSAAWFAKSDFGLTVERTEDGNSNLHIWKVRFRWQGSVGIAPLMYEVGTGRVSEGGPRTEVLSSIDWSNLGIGDEVQPAVDEAQPAVEEPDEQDDLPF